MREFKERSYFRKIIFSRPVFFLLVCVTVLAGSSLFKVYEKSNVAVLKNEEVENEVGRLLQKRDGLESSIIRLKEPGGIEEELREKFQVKKPDEEFVIIVDEETPEIELLPAKEKGGLLEKALNFVKNIFPAQRP